MVGFLECGPGGRMGYPLIFLLTPLGTLLPRLDGFAGNRKSIELAKPSEKWPF
jgi:hypothetical protein